jgi:peptide/nickel transport system substrate-binding protein
MMKKLLCILMLTLITASLFLGSCGEPEEKTTTPATTAPPATTTPQTTAPTEPPADQPQYGGVLEILCMAVPATLGAPWENPMGWQFVGRSALEPLVTNDDEERIQPWLAEDWEIAPDGSSITLYLRQGVKFHDGTEFNADAVKFNLESWPQGSSGAVALSNVTSIDVVDQYTVRLNLKQFDGLLLLQLSQGDVGLMVSPTAMEQPYTSEDRALVRMVGTGPFKLVDFQPSVEASFERWEDYWQEGRPYLEGVVWRWIEDQTVKVMAFETGDAQFIEPVPAQNYMDLKDKGYTMGYGLGSVAVIIPDGANEDSPFAKVEVRQALEYAIDKEAIADTLMGTANPAYQMVNSSSAYYVPGLEPREHDADKARTLLEKAGYPGGFDTEYHVMVMGFKDIQTAVQTYLQEVGINAQIDSIDIPKYFDMINVSGWDDIMFPSFPNVTSNIMALAYDWGITTSYPSMYRPSDWYDKWNAIIAEKDDSARMEKVQEMIKLIADEAILIPVWESRPICASDGTVHDIDYKGRNCNWYYDLVNAWLSD